MEEYRCHNCKGLLYKAKGKIDAEIICSKCRAINYPYEPDKGEIILRGQAFQQNCITHRCDNCCKVLLKTIGDGELEIKCHYCKHTSTHNTKKIRQGNFVFKRTELFFKIKKSIAN